MGTPEYPTPGTDNDRFLSALLDAYPHAVWNPNSRLQLTAHSRAANLRELGWDVQSVSRKSARDESRREYGYVLRMPQTSIADVRRRRPLPLSSVGRDKSTLPIPGLVPAALVSKESQLTMEQLRYLDRVGSVSFDVVTRNGQGRYTQTTARLLRAAGVLVQLGIGLDTALMLVRRHHAEVAQALELARDAAVPAGSVA